MGDYGGLAQMLGIQNAFAGQLGQAQLQQQAYAMQQQYTPYVTTAGTSASITVEYDFAAAKMKKALATKAPMTDTNEAWLDRRVNEMRVTL